MDLRRRADMAHDAGLPAQVVTAAQAAARAPALVDPGTCAGGVLYAGDGPARADVITAALKTRALRAGACFVYATAVTAIDVHGNRVLPA